MGTHESRRTADGSYNGQSILVADVGGTRARFGIVTGDGSLVEERVVECARYSSLVEATKDYLAGVEVPADPLAQAAIAVACPVLGDRVKMTNRLWSFSVEDARRQLDLNRLEVLNDFSSLALSLPILDESDTVVLNPGRTQSQGPLALIGPGTGLGVSALIPCADDWQVLSTEGGHRDLAATCEREWQIIHKLQETFGRVSAERVLSGPGLVNLHTAICELDGVHPHADAAEQIDQGARQNSCPACVETTRTFCRQLGAIAGDLALTFGARRGVFLGGGVIPRMKDVFAPELFLQGFFAKGRFRDYMEPIPVRLIVKRKAALLGAARALQSAYPSGVRSAR